MKVYTKPNFNVVTFESENVLLTTSTGTAANLGLIGEIDYDTDVISAP